MNTHHPSIESHVAPILKIGAVVLRVVEVASGQSSVAGKEGVIRVESRESSEEEVVSRESLVVSKEGVARVQWPVAGESEAGAVVPPPVGGRLGGGQPESANFQVSPPPGLPPMGGGASPGALLAPSNEHPAPSTQNHTTSNEQRTTSTQHPAPNNQPPPTITTHHILIIRPKPKHTGELPPFVLPRGSRQYQDVNGDWQDARDAATGAKYMATLEPFSRALVREIEEEAGVSSDMLARAQVVELGAMAFQSRSKGTYPIHWFVVMPTAADAALLDAKIPADATALEWASRDAIKAMAATGEFSPGYVSVIEAALRLANG